MSLRPGSSEYIQQDPHSVRLLSKLLQDIEAKNAEHKREIQTLDREIRDLRDEEIRHRIVKKFESAYSALEEKLVSKVECPVCMEVPTKDPVYSCPNGHLVCHSCYRCCCWGCPLCRERMGQMKSLLAAAVIENIEHRCGNPGCEEVFPREEAEKHKLVCPRNSPTVAVINQRGLENEEGEYEEDYIDEEEDYEDEDIGEGGGEHVFENDMNY